MITVKYESSSKDAKCYVEYVRDDSDRIAMKKFTKNFSKDLAKKAVKLHKRLESFPNLQEYNKLFGGNQNRIELKSNIKDSLPLVLKVRIDINFRKFFYFVVDEAESEFLKKKNWNNQFEEINTICVCDVNKHNYDPVYHGKGYCI